MEASDLESAIPPHLQQQRLYDKAAKEDYQPPFPAYTTRFPESTKDLVIAIIGAQHKSQPQVTALTSILKFCENENVEPRNLPRHVTLAAHIDQQGFYNEVAIAYWITTAQFQAWRGTSGFQAWWDSPDIEAMSYGHFLEIFLPSLERFETVFSDSIEPEGAAHMRQSMSGPIREHVYWGSMRDRLPVAQRDKLAGEKWTTGHTDPDHNTDGKSPSDTESNKKRVKVAGRQNLTVIRSGQDWSNTLPEERKLYLDTMHPVLIRGMDFLRDHGQEVGCFSCRFMQEVDKSSAGSQETEKTFGLAYFDDLASLEGWSKKHQTHLNIFGGFLKYAKELDNKVSLRLFHEVMVLECGQQEFEYIGCHPDTGMLASQR